MLARRGTGALASTSDVDARQSAEQVFERAVDALPTQKMFELYSAFLLEEVRCLPSPHTRKKASSMTHRSGSENFRGAGRRGGGRWGGRAPEGAEEKSRQTSAGAIPALCDSRYPLHAFSSIHIEVSALPISCAHVFSKEEPHIATLMPRCHEQMQARCQKMQP